MEAGLDQKEALSALVDRIRNDFPVLHQEVHGHPLVYFDNAATNQKPKQVIDAISNYYLKDNSNIHRGAHALAQRATEEFELVRTKAARLLNAPSSEQIIFTYGTTDSVNLLAQAYGRKFIGKGDEIIVSELEHHSNIVPWQIVCEQTGAVLKVIPINDAGELQLDVYQQLLTDKTKLVSVGHVSNALGTINDIKKIIDKAHEKGAVVMIDGAQASAHTQIDVAALDCDFYALSAHKMFGPTGVGILYGKRELLDAMDPYRGGGEMIKEVSFDGTTYNDIPYKFEAGTPNIADVVGFGAALDYIASIGLEFIHHQEQLLLDYATSKMQAIDGLTFVGTAKNKSAVISFLVEGIHHFDLGMMLDARGIAVRTGHHCTQPLMKRLGIDGTTRASFSVYNTTHEIDIFIDALQKIVAKWR